MQIAYQKLLDAAGSLSDFPNQGRVVDGAQRDDIRELIVSPYRIIYRRDEDVVYITMVLPAWAPWLEGSQTAIARRTSSAPTPW